MAQFASPYVSVVGGDKSRGGKNWQFSPKTDSAVRRCSPFVELARITLLSPTPREKKKFP